MKKLRSSKTDTLPVPKAVSGRVLGALRRRTPLWRFLVTFCRAAEAGGGRTYLVGGIVRDLVEGRRGKDIDLMVTGIGFDRLGEVVRSLPQKTLGIRRIVSAGKQFAVYKVATSWSREDVDVALARSERSTGPGHRQFEVRTEGIDAREDASRRDFTVNSLMCAFRTEGRRLSGELIDFFGGMEDLRRRRIRGVGNPADRIREDPLRMLRAIRQKNERPGYIIEKRTWSAIRREAEELIGTISEERLVAELGKSLSANPTGTVSDMHRAGILKVLIPEIPRWGGGPLSRLKKRYAILQRILGRPLPEPLLFANLLVDVAEIECRDLLLAAKKRRRGDQNPAPADDTGRIAIRLPRTDAVARRLHLPHVREVVHMLEDLSRLSHIRLLRNRHARIEAIFRRWGAPLHLIALYLAARRAASRTEEDFRPVLRTAGRRPPLLTGSDIIGMGIPAGPQVDTILEQIREATLTGRISGTEEARTLAARLYGDGAPSRLPHRGRLPRRPVPGVK